MPLLNVGGSEWLERANLVALKLSASDQSASASNELLADIQEVFETKNVTKISTADLINALTEDIEKSWATYNRGKPLSPKQLANKLRDYGICSKTIRLGYETIKGYDLNQFTDAFDRYLLKSSPVFAIETSQTNASKGLSVADDVTATLPKGNSVTNSNVTHKGECDGAQNQRETLRTASVLGCDGVTDRTPPDGRVRI